MDPTALAALTEYLKHQRHYNDYVFISAQTIATWDWMLTLRLEVSLIWLSPLSYTKVLFFLVRYVPIAALYMDIPNRYVVGITVERCKWALPAGTWLLTLGVFFAELILMVRTWAVWRRGREVGYGLLVLFIALTATGFYANINYDNSLIVSTPPYPEFHGCFITYGSSILKVDFFMLTVVDIVVCLLIALSAFRAYTLGPTNQLLMVIHRDGILFYIYFLVAAIFNVITIILLPTDLKAMVTPICCSLYSVLTSRIVLNIRQATWEEKGITTQLHAYEENTTTSADLPLDFHGVNASTGTDLQVV